MKARKRRRLRTLATHTPQGLAPGTLAISANAQKPVLKVMAYGPTSLAEPAVVSLDELAELRAAHPVVWLNVDGLGDEAVLLRIGEIFGLHRLVLEDIANVHQRPKVEAYHDYLFVIFRMVDPTDPSMSEQLALLLGAGWVVTFQERTGDCFDPLRRRIREARGRSRQAGADYLAYSIIDSAIDDLFPTLDAVGHRLDEIEAAILARPEEWQIGALYELKHDLVMLRRVVWPQREALGGLLRDRTPLVHDDTLAYLRDCLDHNLRIIEIVETYRELSASLVDLYLTMVSNRMNEVMKFLTIISTIFIPLGFIAGVYGMNFDTSRSVLNMPELGWRFGYLFCLSLMAATASVMLLFFQRKGWLLNRRPQAEPTASEKPAYRLPPTGGGGTS